MTTQVCFAPADIAVTPVSELTATPAPQVPPTHTPVPLPADFNRCTEGPSPVELIKFAQWNKNRVKLGNWVSGYLGAHGLDHPVRIIEMNPDDYKEGLPHADIDIVFEADPEWAKDDANAEVIVVLGPLSDVTPPDTVNASICQRAPTVGEFLLRY